MSVTDGGSRDRVTDGGRDRATDGGSRDRVTDGAFASRYPNRRRASGGVEARSVRGAFGTTWWGRELVDVVESIADKGRLARGRAYARAGQVLSIQIGRGAIEGEVQGSQIDPFSAVVTVRPLDADAVAELVAAVRGVPGMLAALASGSVPMELADALLPSSARELHFSCTCPDLGWPCRHSAALVYLAAEQIDEEPRKLLTLRGVDLHALISAVSEGREVDGTDHYGDSIELPPLPRVEGRAASADLDAELLWLALRSAGSPAQEVNDAEDELEWLYRLLMGDDHR